MPNLSIKNVPEEVVEKLRQRALANHRSLQGELMAIISGATETASSEPARTLPANKHGTLTIEQIAAKHRKRRPKPFTKGPSATELIRADRDAR